MSTRRLVVVAGPDKGKSFLIQPGVAVLGRHNEVLYILSDIRVSRHHCEVILDENSVVIRDNGSASGTTVNGVKVSTSSPLKSGDKIQVGETILRLESDDAADAAPPDNVPRQAVDYDAKATGQLAELKGRRLKQYQIGEVIGQGKTSMIFRAQDTEDGKIVALKIMQPAYSQDEDEVKRFIRAMKSVMPLDHPNLVRVYAAGRAGPYCWVALELIDGESLTAVIKRIGSAGMLDWRYAYMVAMDVGRALLFAHSKKIIHRNVTPANIMVSYDPKMAKLSDLMLAKGLDGVLAKQVTQPGEVVGDVNYMSPERLQAGNAEVDGRADLFSLSATCYALLSGKPPFAGSNLIETMIKMQTSQPLAPSTFQMGIPSSFEQLIMRGLAKDPNDRVPSAKDWVRELVQIGKFQGMG